MLLSTDPIPRLDGYSDGIMDRPEEAGEGKSGGKRRWPREARCEIGNEKKRERERRRETTMRKFRGTWPRRGGIVSRGQRVNLVCIHASRGVDEWTRLDRTRTIIAFAFYRRARIKPAASFSRTSATNFQVALSCVSPLPIPRRDTRYPSRLYITRATTRNVIFRDHRPIFIPYPVEKR